MVLVLCAISSAAWFQVGNKESADVKEAFKRCRSSFWAKDITRPIELHFGAILRLRKWLEIHHSIISFFCVWIKAKNITIARYFSPKCTSYYYIVFYFFSTVSSRCHFPVLCLVARERQFTLRCPRTLFSANNSNFSRVWNELETSIWQHGKLQFEIYSRTIFVVTFDAISIEWIIIGYFFSVILASLEMRRWYTIIFFSAGHSTEPEPTYNGFHVPFKQI